MNACAWCFPGLRIIDGEEVSHGICPKHKAEIELAIACKSLAARMETGYATFYRQNPDFASLDLVSLRN